jgi:aldehyde dehydrogenase (NAD+)
MRIRNLSSLLNLNSVQDGRQILKYTFDEFSYKRASVDLPKEYVGSHSCTARPDHHLRAEPFLGIRYAPYTEENFKIMAAPALLQIPEKI